MYSAMHFISYTPHPTPPQEKGFDATFAKAVASATGCKADEARCLFVLLL